MADCSRWSGCLDSRSSAGLDWQLSAVGAVARATNLRGLSAAAPNDTSDILQRVSQFEFATLRASGAGRPPWAVRVTCYGCCTSAASTRLCLRYLLPSATVGSRCRYGGGPVWLPCGSDNLLRLGHLWWKTCILRLANECVCDELVPAADGAGAAFQGVFLQSQLS